MPLERASRIITPGYVGPRLCHGCPGGREVEEGEILTNLWLIGPESPDLCLMCLTTLNVHEIIAKVAQQYGRPDAVRALHRVLMAELADIVATASKGSGAYARH